MESNAIYPSLPAPRPTMQKSVFHRGRIAENRSVSLEVQVARQMLAVWTALGFKDAAAKSSDVPGGVDDEL